jgi:malate synthase
MAAFVPEPPRSRGERDRPRPRCARTRSARPATASTAPGVAHPDLVPVATEEFDSVLGERPNQVDRQREDVTVEARDLLDVAVPGGDVTEDGVENNISVGLQYLESWLRGVGAVASTT